MSGLSQLPQEFIKLSVQHKDQLEQFLKQFDGREDELHGYFCERTLGIEQVVTTLNAWENDQELPEGWVGSSTRFWYHDDQLCGVINIRHHLTPHLEQVGGHIGYCVTPSSRRQGIATAMLQSALQICRSRGIDQVLITCDTENVGSWKTIERCGALLDREGWSQQAGKVQRWYWVRH